MDILFITRASREIKFGISDNKSISNVQPQFSWHRSIINLNYKVKLHLVSHNLNFKNRYLNNIPPLISSISLFFLIILYKSKLKYILVSGGIGKLTSITLILINFFFKKKIIYLNGTSPKFFNYDISEIKLAALSSLIVTNSISQLNHWKNITSNKKIIYPISGCDLSYDNYTFNNRPKYELTFIGSLDENIYKFRLDFLNKINNLNLNIWSSSPDVKSLLKKYNLLQFYRGSCNRIQSFDIYNNSKVVLNLHHIESMSNGGNLSLFEIPLSNAFQITNICSDDYFIENKEIVIFKNIDDFKTKLKYYMNSSELRKKIVTDAHKKCLEFHTYDKRFKNIFKIVQ